VLQQQVFADVGQSWNSQRVFDNSIVVGCLWWTRLYVVQVLVKLWFRLRDQHRVSLAMEWRKLTVPLRMLR